MIPTIWFLFLVFLWWGINLSGLMNWNEFIYLNIWSIILLVLLVIVYWIQIYLNFLKLQNKTPEIIKRMSISNFPENKQKAIYVSIVFVPLIVASCIPLFLSDFNIYNSEIPFLSYWITMLSFLWYIHYFRHKKEIQNNSYSNVILYRFYTRILLVSIMLSWLYLVLLNSKSNSSEEVIWWSFVFLYGIFWLFIFIYTLYLIFLYIYWALKNKDKWSTIVLNILEFLSPMLIIIFATLIQSISLSF